MRLADMVASQAPPGSLPLQPTSLIGRDQEFVELAPLADAGLVLQTVAGVVGVPLSPGADPVSALVNYFRPRHALLILDNCEHLLASCATLCEALLRQCAHLQILATSREPLGVAGELRWRVPSLAAPTDEPLAAAE